VQVLEHEGRELLVASHHQVAVVEEGLGRVPAPGHEREREAAALDVGVRMMALGGHLARREAPVPGALAHPFELDHDAGLEKASHAKQSAHRATAISPEDAERIFERFYRAKDPRVAKINGTGLGLTLAREVVRMHGGDITVESQIDQGSTFTMTLPVKVEAA